MFFCRSAMRLPAVMEAAARNHSAGPYTSSRSQNPTNTSEPSATKPAVLEATDRKAVIGVGAPS